MKRDLAVVVTGWGGAQILFHGYEAHVSWRKRVAKGSVIMLIFAGIRQWGGRLMFYGVLGVMTAAISILHGYWFHHRHGIHWRTATPRDRYLALIGKQPA